MDCFWCEAVEETVDNFVIECVGLREARERCGIDACVGVEEELLFEGRTEKGVEGYTGMLYEILRERRSLMELVEIIVDP